MTQFTTIEIDEFKVIGISVRTTNQNGQKTSVPKASIRLSNISLISNSGQPVLPQ
jgi:hypothetical protein